MEDKRKGKVMATTVKVYNSSEKLVFEGTLEEFKNFPTNDSDRVVLG